MTHKDILRFKLKNWGKNSSWETLSISFYITSRGASCHLVLFLVMTDFTTWLCYGHLETKVWRLSMLTVTGVLLLLLFLTLAVDTTRKYIFLQYNCIFILLIQNSNLSLQILKLLLLSVTFCFYTKNLCSQLHYYIYSFALSENIHKIVSKWQYQLQLLTINWFSEVFLSILLLSILKNIQYTIYTVRALCQKLLEINLWLCWLYYLFYIN